MITFWSITILSASQSHAQQLNQVRAFLAPTSQQDSYFPSPQQIQQALSTPVAQQESSFPPLEQMPQAFINQFTTPDAPRVKQTAPFPAPISFFNNNMTMPQQYKSLNTGYQQPAMKFPAAPRSYNKKNNLGTGNNTNPFSSPNAFPAMPFSTNNGSNPVTGWNKNMTNTGNGFPFMPSTNSNKKKAWGDKRNIWPDFYTDFTDTAWDEAIGGPRKLGRMPGGWRFPYVSTPDPVTVSDAITNKFPPIAEEAGHMTDISKWGVFDGQ